MLGLRQRLRCNLWSGGGGEEGEERSGGALLPRCLDTLVCLLSGSLSAGAGGVSVRKTTKH